MLHVVLAILLAFVGAGISWGLLKYSHFPRISSAGFGVLVWLLGMYIAVSLI